MKWILMLGILIVLQDNQRIFFKKDKVWYLDPKDNKIWVWDKQHKETLFSFEGKDVKRIRTTNHPELVK